ncbi:DUF5123 domain-containing protein [Arachidicoccus terrestris]|uniref:DUF5123 domain-containing protein n=1 Tax=Arachidicoccus terrestris TaxID=2875539 RepID=UPI001CC3A87B|nr:DUF5123 domain-containing protein [Arachidicoccus terrestris]UAY54526.1 DUF5123 domain-containing protein [Arachidicoccus terrestris]
MKNILFKLMAFILIVFFAASCQKEVNNWDVDPSHARLFKPLTFEVQTTAATSVTINYTRSIGATKYIFEFSKDSLEFKDIVRTVEILADTLTPFSVSPTPTRTSYHTVFEDLDGTSGYSVRMKCVDSTGNESKYSELYFMTPAEQLFDRSEQSTDNIQMFWQPTDRVTHVTVSDPVTLSEIKKVTLTEENKADGSVLIPGLNPGTSYKIEIFNNDVLRGTMILHTTGIKGAVIVPVASGDDINAVLAEQVAEGHFAVTLLFNAGQNYDIGSVVLPSGLTDLSFTGEREVWGDNAMPSTLNISNVALEGNAFGSLIFQKVKLIGGTGDYLINMGDDNVDVGQFAFANCDIENYRGVVRVQNKAIRLSQISLAGSIVKNTGGYGVINVGGSNVTLDSIKVDSNTLIDMATQLMDVRAAVPLILVNSNTIYNQNVALTQLIRLDKNNLPSSFTAENNIISGTNAGAPLKAFSLDYAGSFAGSYRTTEMEISQDFPEITLFEGSSTDLFVNPANGDFSIIPLNGFGGTGKAGDPRWFVSL